MKRVAVAVVLLALLVVAARQAFRWADEPNHRRHCLLTVPIVLKPGTRSAGSFTPDHDGPFTLNIQIELDRSAEEFAELLGGGWFGHDEPPGLAIDYVIRSEGSVVQRGVCEGDFTGRSSPPWIAVTIEWLDDGRPQPYEAEIHIRRAHEEFAALPASFTVEAAGDYISYAWLAASTRHAIVGLGIFLVAIVGGAVLIVSSRRRRKRHARDLARAAKRVASL